MFKLLTDSLFVAICRFNWLYSRKYGTVWYHPTSFRFYLTVFILCQYQGKNWLARFRISTPGPHAWSQLIQLAVCLAWGADFTSTMDKVGWRSTCTYIYIYCGEDLSSKRKLRVLRPWQNGAPRVQWLKDSFSHQKFKWNIWSFLKKI
jgi:hypothetical protein